MSIDVRQPYDACGIGDEVLVARAGDGSIVQVFDKAGRSLRYFGQPATLGYTLSVRRPADLRQVINEGALYCDEDSKAVYYFHWVLGRVTRFAIDGSVAWSVPLEPVDFTTLEAGNGYCCGKLPDARGEQLEGHMPIALEDGILYLSVSEILDQGRTRRYVYRLDGATGAILGRDRVDRFFLGRAGRQRYEFAPGLSSTILVSRDAGLDSQSHPVTRSR